MSYIDSTRKSYSSPYEITVCMTKEECKILLPFFQKAYKSVKSKYEKYNDIHNGGEATEREENLLMKYSEQLERLESVLSSIDDILKYFRNMTEKQKQQYLTAQQAREIATTPYREVFTKIKMAAESGKCSLTIGFCTDVSELVEILKSVGYSVTLTTSYRDSVMKIHRIYSIQW